MLADCDCQCGGFRGTVPASGCTFEDVLCPHSEEALTGADLEAARGAGGTWHQGIVESISSRLRSRSASPAQDGPPGADGREESASARHGLRRSHVQDLGGAEAAAAGDGWNDLEQFVPQRWAGADDVVGVPSTGAGRGRPSPWGVASAPAAATPAGASRDGAAADSPRSPVSPTLDMLHDRAKRIQAAWRRRTSSEDLASGAVSPKASLGRRRAQTEIAPATSTAETDRGRRRTASSAASLIQSMWRGRRESGELKRERSEAVWARFGGCSVDGADSLPGSGKAVTEEEAKEHCLNTPECMGFTFDQGQNPPVAWFHAHIRPSACMPGRAGRDRQCSLWVHSRRFERLHGCFPGVRPGPPTLPVGAVAPLSALGGIGRPWSLQENATWLFTADETGVTPVAGAMTGAAVKIQKLWRKRSVVGPGGPAGSGDPFHAPSAPGRLEHPALDGAGGLTPTTEVSSQEASSRYWFGDTVRWLETQARAKFNLPANEKDGKDKGLLESWWEDSKKRALEGLLTTSAPMLKKTMGDLGAVVEENATQDPDMWAWVRPLIRNIVKSFWMDVEMEIESGLKMAVLSRPARKESSGASDPALEPRWFRRLGLAIRAAVLHHYLPCNKSIYGKLMDPAYLLMVATTMLPVFGIRVFFFTMILVMLLFPGPPDEFQLINFILIFKGTQFFTTGVLLGFVGAMEYYVCYLFAADSLRACIDKNGPGAGDWLYSLLFDYVGSMTLVWVAFLALPLSRTHWSEQYSLGNKHEKPPADEVYCCCLRGNIGRGGRLRWLLRYDLVCFILSFAVFLPTYFESSERMPSEADVVHDAKAKQTIFWCRILYSLFSLPFVVFVIPGVGKVLTHGVMTGYDRTGACVEFAYDSSRLKQTQVREHRKAG